MTRFRADARTTISFASVTSTILQGKKSTIILKIPHLFFSSSSILVSVFGGLLVWIILEEIQTIEGTVLQCFYYSISSWMDYTVQNEKLDFGISCDCNNAP